MCRFRRSPSCSGRRGSTRSASPSSMARGASPMRRWRTRSRRLASALARRGRRAGRHRRRAGAEHPGDAGGALRRADGRRRAADRSTSGWTRRRSASSCSIPRRSCCWWTANSPASPAWRWPPWTTPPPRGRHRRLRSAGGRAARRAIDYEAFLAGGDPAAPPRLPDGRVGGDRAVLHLGHHRQSEGRRRASPRRLPECLRQCAGLRR